MTDGAILRTVLLPRYDDTLTLVRSTVFSRFPYVIMGELHGVSYPKRFCASEQEAHDYLNHVSDSYEMELKDYVRQKEASSLR